MFLSLNSSMILVFDLKQNNLKNKEQLQIDALKLFFVKNTELCR